MSKKPDVADKIKQTKEKIEEFKSKINNNEIGVTLKQKGEDIADLVLNINPFKKMYNKEAEVVKKDSSNKQEQTKSVAVNSLCWAGNEEFQNQFATVDESGRIALWDAKKGKKFCEEPKATNGLLMTCAIEPRDSKLLVCGGIDAKVMVFSINPKGKKKEKLNFIQKEKDLTGHMGMITCCGFLDQQYIITGSNDSFLMLWDLEKSHKDLVRYNDHESEVVSLDVFPQNGNIIVSGSGDTTARIWDIRMRTSCLRVFENSGAGVSSVKFLPHSYQTIAAGLEDSSIKIYDLRTLAPIAELKEENSYECVHSMCFSQSGRLLFSSYNTPTIKVWDVVKEKKATVLQGPHAGIVRTIALSREGDIMGSASKDGVISLWN